MHISKDVDKLPSLKTWKNVRLVQVEVHW